MRNKNATIYVEEVDSTLFCNWAETPLAPGNSVRVRSGGSFRAGIVLGIDPVRTTPGSSRVTIVTASGRVKKYTYAPAGQGFRLSPIR
jgi:hypothetical protein